MASILSFANRMFRTRNPARDANTDRNRMIAVRIAVVEAIDSARRERDGLKRRVDAYYAQASALLDDSPEYAERSSSEEGLISEAEQAAAAALQRIGMIDAQLEHFSGILHQIDDAGDVGPALAFQER
jgi:hypothetical protein